MKSTLSAFDAKGISFEDNFRFKIKCSLPRTSLVSGRSHSELSAAHGTKTFKKMDVFYLKNTTKMTFVVMERT
jgi:hypothetical protein